MDKMANETYLGIDEIEQLCILYMECRLSRLEEAELHYVLGKMAYSSPVIDKVRTLMDISLSCAIEKIDNPADVIIKNKKALVRKWLLIAASVAIIISVGIPIFQHFSQESEFYCQVFANGVEINGDKALTLAEDEHERIDSFFENMNSIESEQKKKIESL